LGLLLPRPTEPEWLKGDPEGLREDIFSSEEFISSGILGSTGISHDPWLNDEEGGHLIGAVGEDKGEIDLHGFFRGVGAIFGLVTLETGGGSFPFCFASTSRDLSRRCSLIMSLIEQLDGAQEGEQVALGDTFNWLLFHTFGAVGDAVASMIPCLLFFSSLHSFVAKVETETITGFPCKKKYLRVRKK